MTVGELIEALEVYGRDAEVFVRYESSAYGKAEDLVPYPNDLGIPVLVVER